MKTTRRNLLRFIGLGAAAAALAPAGGVAAEEEHDAEFEQVMARYERGLVTWDEFNGAVRGEMGSGPLTMQQAAAWVDPKAEADFLKWIEG